MERHIQLTASQPFLTYLFLYIMLSMYASSHSTAHKPPPTHLFHYYCRQSCGLQSFLYNTCNCSICNYYAAHYHERYQLASLLVNGCSRDSKSLLCQTTSSREQSECSSSHSVFSAHSELTLVCWTQSLIKLTHSQQLPYLVISAPSPS